MIRIEDFAYKPLEHEAEKASNTYLMSLVALMIGLPIPIVNFIATLIMFFAYRDQTLFVRWHATQALLSQASLLIFNVIGYFHVVLFIFWHVVPGLWVIIYLGILFLINLAEFIMTIISAIYVRRGRHVTWWVLGTLADRWQRP